MPIQERVVDLSCSGGKSPLMSTFKRTRSRRPVQPLTGPQEPVHKAPEGRHLSNIQQELNELINVEAFHSAEASSDAVLNFRQLNRQAPDVLRTRPAGVLEHSLFRLPPRRISAMELREKAQPIAENGYFHESPFGDSASEIQQGPNPDTEADDPTYGPQGLSSPHSPCDMVDDFFKTQVCLPEKPELPLAVNTYRKPSEQHDIAVSQSTLDKSLAVSASSCTGSTLAIIRMLSKGRPQSAPESRMVGAWNKDEVNVPPIIYEQLPYNLESLMWDHAKICDNWTPNTCPRRMGSDPAPDELPQALDSAGGNYMASGVRLLSQHVIPPNPLQQHLPETMLGQNLNAQVDVGSCSSESASESEGEIDSLERPPMQQISVASVKEPHPHRKSSAQSRQKKGAALAQPRQRPKSAAVDLSSSRVSNASYTSNLETLMKGLQDRADDAAKRKSMRSSQYWYKTRLKTAPRQTILGFASLGDWRSTTRKIKRFPNLAMLKSKCRTANPNPNDPADIVANILLDSR